MEIKDIFKKCISVRQTGDGMFLPMRFTKAQEERYDRIEWTPYQRCPAGVTMEFITDADEISFDFKVLVKFWNIFCFDIFENETYTGCVKLENADSGTVSYKKTVPGKVEMKIFLPVHSELVFGNFKLGNISPVPEKQYRHKILMVGDSISQGLFSVHPSLAYVPQLASFLDADYINNSVGGDIFDPDTIDTAQGFDPDVILVAMGTNDMCFVGDIEKIKSNMDALFCKISASYPKAKVNVISMPWETEIWDERFAGKYGNLFELYKQIEETQLIKAKEHGFNAIRGWDLIPHSPEFFADTAHPNDLGFCRFALNVLKQLDY